MFNIEMLTLTKTVGSQDSVIHPVIIFNDSDLVLCDTGYPDQADEIDDELQKYGFSINDITRIVISHQDHDHIGSLSELKRLNKNLTVISSGEELPFIEGQKQSLRLLQAEEYNKKLSGEELELGIQFANYLKTIQGCKVDRTVNDGDYIIPGLKIIATPGHTPGHVSLFDEYNHIFISGDALAIENNKLVIANPEFTLDPERCMSSIRKIVTLNPQKIICYHGGIIEGNINALLNRIV
jgi:glyoxylase-like metal-dependent hydrolase (beta-lactamase superfamily II)